MNTFKGELLTTVLDDKDIQYDEYVEDDNHVKLGVLHTKFVDTDLDCILIQIASYKDALLPSTIKSAIVQADHPERIHFAISYQYDDLSTFYSFCDVNNCKVIHIPLDKAQGACYARNLCQRMLSDEKYVLHIDPHSRFVKHWDTAMTAFLDSKNDPMGFISGYPCGVSDDDCLLPLDHSKFDKPQVMSKICMTSFRPIARSNRFYSTILSQIGSFSAEQWKDVTFDRHPLIGACYFFGYANIDRTVKVDPNMWLYGDESPMSLRLFTYGFNNYIFTECYVYHKWSHTGRSYQTYLPNHGLLEEDDRIRRLWQGELNDQYGLGTVRTVAEYEEFAGIDFKNRLIKHRAQLAEYGSDIKLVNECPTFDSFMNSRQFLRQDSFKFHVFILDVDGHASECFDNVISTVDNISNVNVTIVSNTSVSVAADVRYKRCDRKSFSDFFWTICDGRKDNCYTMCMLSNMRLVKGWDTYYSDILSCLSDRDVVTSSISTNPIKVCANGYMPGKITYTGSSESFERKKMNVEMIHTIDPKNAMLFGSKMHPYLIDHFLIAKSSVFSDIIKDCDVSFYDFPLALSVRLFMQGYNLSYSNKSYIYATNVLLNMDKVFPDYNTYKICNILGIGGTRYAKRGDPLSKDVFDNIDSSLLRSRNAFYFACGFDFWRMQSI